MPYIGSQENVGDTEGLAYRVINYGSRGWPFTFSFIFTFLFEFMFAFMDFVRD